MDNNYLLAGTLGGIHSLDLTTIDPSTVHAENATYYSKTPYQMVLSKNRNGYTIVLPSNRPGLEKITIFDLRGRNVFTHRFLNNVTTEVHIPIPVKGVGLHILEVTTTNGKHRIPILDYK